jgi:hypothetical protein
MKQKYLIGIFSFLFSITITFSQSAGDIAFIAFNADGDDDFSIVALADISANSTIYFTDTETTGVGSPSALASGEGTITWNSGPNIINAGTIVVFTDVDSDANPSFGASIGTITKSGSFTLSASKDGIIAYIGTEGTPTTYIAAIQIGNDNAFLGPFDGDGITLTNTSLVIGTSIIIADNSASPDGGHYNLGSRSSETSYADYYSLINTNSNWTTSTSDGEQYLPYSQEAFTINTTNWTGGTSSVWNLAGNWDNGIPSSSSLVTIPNVATSPIISSGTLAQVGNITIDASEVLTINAANSLTINGTLTVNGELNTNSEGSLIVKGTSTGNISYSRTLTTNWHLLSSPVGSQDINTFTVTDVATNAIATSGTNYGVAPYDNNGSAWVYYTTGTIGAAGNFVAGKGYSALRTSAGDVTFTGTMPTSDVSIAITDGTANEWNLIGNPYPSYIPANSGADATNNFITINTADLNASYQAVYFWNGTSYVAVNHASGSRFIAPGQGFFVNSIASGSTVDFTEAMQSHQTTDVFSKTKSGSSWPEINVLMTDGATNKSTDIKYITGTTTGLDPGYDAGMFTGTSNAFSVYTHLVTDSEGIDFSLQALPDDDYENISVPIGFTSVSGKEITFSVNHSNLPTGLMVFLEDKVENKITRLDEENTNYKISLSSENKGVGRFYLRTSTTDLSKTLSTDNFDLNNVKIYFSSKENLRISGLNSNTSNPNITIYNILGKTVFNKSFNSKPILDVTIPNTLNQGIYIVKIATSEGHITKKLFLK